MDLRDALYEIQGLKAIWEAKRFNEYLLVARAFLQEWREPIRNAARYQEPFLSTVRCLEALLVIHDNLATADEDVRRADEDLFLVTAPRFLPRTPEQQRKHDFEIPNLTGNIAKRRAFAALRRGRIDEASVLFDQAVTSAELAAALLGTQKPAQGAIKHLQYLRFHRAIAAMLLAEGKGLSGDAEAWWSHAKNAADHSQAPTDLFVGRGYILDREDFNAYVHLIQALGAFLENRFEAAAEAYEVWLTAVPHRRGHWRFQNVAARKYLAEVFNCAEKRCPHCPACSGAAYNLEQFLSRWGVGRAGRELARIGLAVHHVGATFEAGWLQMILDGSVFPILPLCVSVPESTSPSSGNYIGLLPHYFVGLHAELTGLRRLGCSEIVLRDFILRRLRDFIEVCAEYESGRTAIYAGDQTIVDGSFSDSITALVSLLIDARTARKSLANFGTKSWARIKDQVNAAEMDQHWERALDVYKDTTESMAGYFPAILRVVSRAESHSQKTEHITSVEQLGGDEFEIRSQFPLIGDVGYLPPRYVRGRLTEKLLANDRSKWVPATKAAALFVFQTIPVWEGNWNQLKDEFESQFLDFKREQPQSLAKHLAAFSNSRGGWLVFGVNDPEDRTSGAIARGLNLIECTALIDAIAQAGLNKVDPIIVPTNAFRAYPEGKLVVLYRIDRSIVRPHRVSGKIYVRVGATSQPITDEAWNKMAALL